MKGITPNSLLTDLRALCDAGPDDEGNPIWIAKRERALWLATEVFMLKPRVESLAALDTLWDQCNLPLKPMRVFVKLAVTEMQGASVPDLDEAIPSFFELDPVEPTQFGHDGSIAFLPAEGDPVQMWRRADGSWTSVAQRAAQFVRRHGAPAMRWLQGAPDSTIIGVDEYGEAAAAIQPIKLAGTGKLIRDPDLPQQLFEVRS